MTTLGTEYGHNGLDKRYRRKEAIININQTLIRVWLDYSNGGPQFPSYIKKDLPAGTWPVFWYGQTYRVTID